MEHLGPKGPTPLTKSIISDKTILENVDLTPKYLLKRKIQNINLNRAELFRVIELRLYPWRYGLFVSGFLKVIAIAVQEEEVTKWKKGTRK